MPAYLCRRALVAVPTLFLVSIVTFVALRAIPGNPVEILAGPSASAEAVAAAKARYGLDRPIITQYVVWASAALRGDWGTAFVTQTPLVRLLPQRFKNTAALAVCGLAFAALLGVPAGILAAKRRGGLVDLLIMAGVNAGAAMPAFWFGLLLILAFAIRLRWFPVEGIGGLRAFILPSVTIGFEAAALIARLTRNGLVEELSSDYVRTARSKGLPEGRVLLRHALRNVLIALATVFGLQLGALLGGAVFTETIFVWPGVGRLIVDAVLQRDYPLVQMGVLLTAATLVIVNIFVDAVYAYLDPRVQYG